MKVIRLISLSSICCVGLAILCDIPYCTLLLSNTYSDELLITILYLFRAALVLGIIAVFAILIARTYWRGLIPAMLAILISGAVVWVDIGITRHSRERQEILKNEIGDYNLKLLGKAFIQYAEANSGYLPSAENWCDSLLKKNIELTRENFKHPKADYLGLKGDCQFAFNKNLSGMRLTDIPDDVILLFEADGTWNLNGTGGLLKTRYQEQGYITVLFVDQTTGNYWFYKDAVRKFDKKRGMYYEQPHWNP